MCVLDPKVLRDDEGDGDGGRDSCRCRYDDTVESLVPKPGPSTIGSGVDDNPRSGFDPEPIVEDQELRLELNGSDITELAAFSLRKVTLSGNVRLLLPSKLLSRVVGTRNTSLTSWRAGSHKREFCSIASFS